VTRNEGHREKLLEGAKRCLYEKGWARTTARDLVAASGTNLASIGYHFGSKEALLAEALFAALDDLSDQFDGREAAIAAATEAVEAGEAPPPPIEQLRETWAGTIESFSSHRPVWVASLEAFAQVEHLPDLRRQMSDVYEGLRNDLAEMARAADPTLDDATARTFGSFHLAVLAGLTLQWLVDPDRAPSSDDLVAALRTTIAIAGDPEHTGTNA
jgi:AcrR family transcriptional regulator